MVHRLALVRFDLPQEAGFHPDLDPEPKFGGPAADPLEAPLADTVAPDVSECLPVDDSTARDQPDPADIVKQIADAVERLSRDIVPLREAAIEAAARAFGQAAAAAVPHLAKAGIAAEIAQASLDIARAGPKGRLLLLVAEVELEAVRSCLSNANVDLADKLDLRASPALGAGQAALEWTDGGGLFDAATLTASALDLLQQHLPQPKTKETPE